MFAKVYVGCACGETWHVEMVDEGDIAIPVCTHCYKTCTPKIVNGQQVVHVLEEDEAYNEMGIPDDDDRDWGNE